MEANLGQPIAYGRTAEVYAWHDRQVLKLFYDWVHVDGINYEQQIALAVHSSGLPVPAVGKIVTINGRVGLAYERMQGCSMGTAMGRRPWQLVRYARQMANLHVAMHTTPLDTSLPSQHLHLRRKIVDAKALPSHLSERILTYLETMPQGSCLCHGDFHPENIMVTQTGATIIDWVDCTLGNPLADVARTSIILLKVVGAGSIAQVLIRLFHTLYLRRYFALRPAKRGEYEQWLPIVAAARMSEGIVEINDWLLQQALKCQ